MENNSDNFLRLRIENIASTQRHLHRLFILAYLLLFLLSLAWYNSNFEEVGLERDIRKLQNAISIEKLKPWDKFLENTASCFHSYFFGHKGTVITKQDLEHYINYFESENKRNELLIKLGGRAPYRVDDLKSLLQSEEYWNKCAFWVNQHTVLSFLYSIDYYLQTYLITRISLVDKNQYEGFLASTDSINPFTDTMLVSLYSKVNSLKKPFEYSVRVGWNPFESGLGSSTARWGWKQPFDEYAKYDLEELLLKLQKLNHLSYFKKLISEHKKLLQTVEKDLRKMLFSHTKGDTIRFSQEETDVIFYDLPSILNSPLLSAKDLPDSIMLSPMIDYTVLNDDYSPISHQKLLQFYFPDFFGALREYKLENLSSIKNWKNILTSQRGSTKQRIQALGVEISTKSIFYFLPFASACIYLLALIYMLRLRSLLSLQQELNEEIMKGPFLIAISPLWLGTIIITLPGLLTLLLLVDQLLLAGKRGIALSSHFTYPLVLVYFVILCFIVSNRWKLAKHTISGGNHCAKPKN